MSADPSPPHVSWQQEGDSWVLHLSGTWRREGPAPVIEGKTTDDGPFPQRFVIDELAEYDSTLPAYLLALYRDVPQESRHFEGLSDNLRGLLELALAVPEESGNQTSPRPSSELRKLGKITLSIWIDLQALFDFVGQAVLSLGRFFLGKARFRTADFWLVLQQCGVQALPIVSLISFLIGLILAFVGNVQLTNFGANLFVADLVGIAMVREMGVVMTAIIMSGRTGAAYAALIGSMKANEEIDALRTFGFDPFDFLVLPRLLALVLMMPILTIYANVVGILGGMLVGAMVGIPPVLYWTETLAAVDLTNASLGVIKSVFFGFAIAVCGCMQGLRAGNSSAAVGEATTRAVVASITAIIVLDSAFAVIFTLLEI